MWNHFLVITTSIHITSSHRRWQISAAKVGRPAVAKKPQRRPLPISQDSRTCESFHPPPRPLASAPLFLSPLGQVSISQFHSSDGVIISIAPTPCSRSYRTAQLSWHRCFCELCTAWCATPRHENHARCCVSVFLCGSDSRFTAEMQSEPQIGTKGRLFENARELDEQAWC